MLGAVFDRLIRGHVWARERALERRPIRPPGTIRAEGLAVAVGEPGAAQGSIDSRDSGPFVTVGDVDAGAAFRRLEAQPVPGEPVFQFLPTPGLAEVVKRHGRDALGEGLLDLPALEAVAARPALLEALVPLRRHDAQAELALKLAGGGLLLQRVIARLPHTTVGADPIDGDVDVLVISPDAYARLQAVASKSQRTVSDVVRHAVEGLPVRPRRQSRGHDDLVRQLIRIGNNLNQQTRLLHVLGHRGELPGLEELLATLEQVKDTLRSVSGRVGTESASDP